jgi:hypothetical protein
MSIQQDVIELQDLDNEMKRLRKQMRTLKEQKERCEKRILEYLDVNEQPGLKMNGTIIMAQDRRKRKYQRKSDKLARGEYILQKHGLFNSKEALDEVLEAMRGSPESKPTLKIY